MKHGKTTIAIVSALAFLLAPGGCTKKEGDRKPPAKGTKEKTGAEPEPTAAEKEPPARARPADNTQGNQPPTKGATTAPTTPPAKMKKIGNVTSGTMIPGKKIGMGLGYVIPELQEYGSEFEVRIKSREVPAVVVNPRA